MIKYHKGRLWADIFAPKNIKQLIGNSVNIKKFKDWMMSWLSAKRVEMRKNTKKGKKPKTKDGNKQLINNFKKILNIMQCFYQDFQE